MRNSIVLICTAVAIVASGGMAEEVRTQNRDLRVRTPRVTRFPSPNFKYYKMDKKQLQEELKRLLRDYSIAEKGVNEADAHVAKAKEAYESAPDEKKPEELLRMLEAQAKRRNPHLKFLSMKKEFEAAKAAYIAKVANELREVKDVQPPH
jgi:hypothetical protein